MKKITQQVKRGAADLRRIRKQSSEGPKLVIETKANKERNRSFLPPPLKRENRQEQNNNQMTERDGDFLL